MIKLLGTALAFFMVLGLQAQENEYGKMDGEVLHLSSGIDLKKGTRLKLQGASGADNHYVTLYHAPNNMFDDMKFNPSQKLEPYYALSEVSVHKIKYVKGKKDKTGKWMVKLHTDSKKDIVCDIVEALKVGELVLVDYSHTPMVLHEEDKKSVPFSVADELAKLKKLLDEGVLTQEEFDAQKKKLLEQ